MTINKSAARKNFLKKNLTKNAGTQMSKFCRLAHVVYQTWEEDGDDVLQDYLINTISCSPKHVEKIVQNYHPENPPAEVCPIQIIEKGNYNETFKLMSLYIEDIWPHNLLGWYLMRHAYGADAFDFELVGTGEGRDNKIIFPHLIKDANGMHIPFGLAALNVIEVGKLPAHVIKKVSIFIDKLGKDVGTNLAKTLLDADFIFPPKKVLEQLVSAVKRGLDGETVILTGAFCPDYAYEETGRKDIPYRYTFNNVGREIGLVAQQFQRVLPHLINFFQTHGINYRIQLGIGDFEANSDEILRQVNLNKDEFVGRCAHSLNAFMKALPEVNMDLRLFELQWSNGRFETYTKEACEKLLQGDFGEMKVNTGKDPRHEISFIAKDGQEFYRRWFGIPNMTLKDIEKRVAAQLAEYAAMGRVFKDDFGDQPFIQIAGDRPKMQVGNSMYSDHPTLCCKRIY